MATEMFAEQRLANGAEGDRTLNLSIANAALSQLSYRPGRWVNHPQSNVENGSTQVKMRGVNAAGYGPGLGWTRLSLWLILSGTDDL